MAVAYALSAISGVGKMPGAGIILAVIVLAVVILGIVFAAVVAVVGVVGIARGAPARALSLRPCGKRAEWGC